MIGSPPPSSCTFHRARNDSSASGMRREHAADLAQDVHGALARDVLEQPGPMHDVEGAAAEGEGGGVALDQREPGAAQAGGPELRTGEIGAEQDRVREAGREPAHHRPGATGEVEHAGPRAGLDSVEDPASEEARLLFEAIGFLGVGLAVDVAGHGANSYASAASRTSVPRVGGSGWLA